MRTELNEKQKSFLDGRLAQIASIQPEILELKVRLLKIDGCHLVAPPKPEPDLTALLAHGDVMEGAILFEEMSRSSCHWNVAALWRSEPSPLVAIGTGYALSEDGLWRQHSWGITKTEIFETTEPRHTYFGISLQKEEAAKFASQHADKNS
jgi:hypothetical protein